MARLVGSCAGPEQNDIVGSRTVLNPSPSLQDRREALQREVDALAGSPPAASQLDTKDSKPAAARVETPTKDRKPAREGIGNPPPGEAERPQMKDDPVLMESEVNRDPDAASEEAAPGPQLLQVGKHRWWRSSSANPTSATSRGPTEQGRGAPATMSGSPSTEASSLLSASRHQTSPRATNPPNARRPRRHSRNPDGAHASSSSEVPRNASAASAPNPRAPGPPSTWRVSSRKPTRPHREQGRRAWPSSPTRAKTWTWTRPTGEEGGPSPDRGRPRPPDRGGARQNPPKSPSTQSPNPSSPASQLQPAPRGAPQRGDDRQARPTGRPRSFRQP